MPKALDTILGHCMLRAAIAEEGGLEAVAAKSEAGEALSKWDAIKALARVTPKASRVATFIVLWAVAMRMEGLSQFSITEYQRYWSEGERQTYRVQKEFRQLFPEFETPDEIARRIVKHIDGRMSKKQAAKLPMTLRVELSV